MCVFMAFEKPTQTLAYHLIFDVAFNPTYVITVMYWDRLIYYSRDDRLLFPEFERSPVA